MPDRSNEIELDAEHAAFLDRVQRREVDPDVAVWGISGKIGDCVNAGLVTEQWSPAYRLTVAGRTALAEFRACEGSETSL